MASPTRVDAVLHRFLPNRQRKNREHVGKIASRKIWYEAEDDSNEWVEWTPPTLPEPKRVKFEGHAVHVYMTRDQKNDFSNNTTYSASKITINSPYLREELEEVIKKYDVSFKNGVATFSYPFKPLFFSREVIREKAIATNDENTREHLKILWDVIEEVLGDTIDAAEELEKDESISFDLLWTLFPHGSMATAPEFRFGINATRCFRVKEHIKSKDKNPKVFKLRGTYVAFNGSKFVVRMISMHINKFHGTKKISQLEAVPLRSRPDYPEIEHQLKKRGQRVVDEFQTAFYAVHSRHVGNQGGGNAVVESSDELVIIDHYKYSQERDDLKGSPIAGYEDLPSKQRSGDEGEASSLKLVDIASKSRGAYDGISDDDIRKNRNAVLLNEENLTLISPIVFGFSLANKKWGAYDIEYIRPVSSSDEAINHLVFDPKKKELLSALVDNHLQTSKQNSDVINGKGQGLLVLLSGPPGTGKTLMAEAIAAKTGTPLYTVDMSALLPNPAERLKTIMQLTTSWKAILLLDEADLYLQKRSAAKLDMIEQVSAFLSELEYFGGVIFLTTNDSNLIDRAVISRVHVHLQFSPLDATRRSQVWTSFISRLPPKQFEISKEQIESLSKWKLNGREIRNMLRTTITWRSKDQRPITLDDLDNILAITYPNAGNDGKDTDASVNELIDL
ncbi:P-loop containing nucleoside triphosphate hydrolase protein [Lojkania enalia]|uniref:P-loop containing nucleoside triphosphate hydrolase protein n=1 Tax=Lojkania enalia TaxID=147567 RepID=A0A9P4KJP2_9PLEO|nr:P-loop containing nucleoside triphosphate hydrolase protein [Didymosphaeria enalia]